MQRVEPIGFVGCDPRWLTNPPPYTSTNRPYTADEFRRLSLHYVGREDHLGQSYAVVGIANSGNTHVSAVSSIGMPIRLSWRFIDEAGKPLSGWNSRQDLFADIPADGSLNLTIRIDSEMAAVAATMEVSIVQELAFWGHDIGISPLAIDLKPR
jgi:hypothetical protein